MNKKRFLLLAALFSPVIAISAETEVSIPQHVSYYDKNIIQENVQRECTTLGSDLSAHIAQAMEANGYKVRRIDASELGQPPMLDVKITNLMSAGNAFFGHKKSVTVMVKMQKDGQGGEPKSFTRATMGGIAAGFKSSCQVLDRAIEAIGKDIARWYKATNVAPFAPQSVEASPAES